MIWPDVDHLFLSAHLDDAALSCGGLLHQLAQRGEPAAVVTICAGDPVKPLSDYARAHHERWNLAAVQAVQARRSEDIRALALLGETIQAVHLSIPDAIYRRHAGAALYASGQQLFGPPHPDDPAWQTLANLPRPTGRVYAPLAVGHHVDHVLLRQTVERWRHPDVWYYEDYPYNRYENAVQAALDGDEGRWEAHVIPLAEADLDARLGAAAAYTSQLSTFWPSKEALYADLVTVVRRDNGEVYRVRC
ncbi:MAG: PIG-L family deacetylase [Chloroflexi bacterium]|nr:PIG-L family deacetylase [Chloroflexota bacterium]